MSETVTKTEHHEKPPTAMEIRFLDEYVANGENAAAAYQLLHPRANSLTARTNASKILARTNISQHLQAAREAFREANRPRYNRVLEEWGKIAHADLGQILDFSKDPPTLRKYIPPSARQAIQSITITPIPAQPPKKGKRKGKPLAKIEVKMIDKCGALDKISRHLGVYDPMPPIERILSGLPEFMAEGIRVEIRKHLAARGKTGGHPRVGNVVDHGEDPGAGRDVRGPQQDPGPVASKIPRELFDTVDGARLSSGGHFDEVLSDDIEPLFK